MSPKIIVGSDHAGYELKVSLVSHLETLGYQVTDVGCANSIDSVDYPDMAALVAQTMKEQGVEKGLITCGSGVGVAIAANRFPWVRAVHAHDTTIAQLSREHNNSNVLCMGGRFLATFYAQEILTTWLTTLFQGERHEKRVNLLSSLN